VTVQFSPIQRIINEASEGATITVPPGVYYGLFKVNKTLTLIGEGVVIDANGSQVGIIISAPNVVLMDFTIQGAIRLNGGYPPEEISELWVGIAEDGSGIYVYMALNVTLSNVKITDCYAGVGAVYSPLLSLRGCEVARTTWGLALERSAGVTVFGCLITDNYYLPDNNGGGVWAGLYTAVEITSSTFARNLWGIVFLPSSASNHVHYNNFVNSTHANVCIHPDAGYVGNLDLNYWSDYSGIDQNGDSIGDTPYIIDQCNQDRHPLMTDPETFGGPNPDLNNDGKVDIRDVALVAKAYGSTPGSQNWNTVADVNRDLRIDIKDVAFVAASFGK